MRLIACALALAAGGGLLSIVVAEENPLAQPRTAQPAAALPPKTEEPLDARFMQILEELARISLDRFKQVNARAPGVVAPENIALLELQVKTIDKLRQETMDAGRLNGFSLLIGLAEASKTKAAMEWKRIVAIRERSPASISQSDAELARLRSELANVNLLRGQAAANGSAEEQQNWALQYLVVELQSLHDQVRNLETRQ